MLGLVVCGSRTWIWTMAAPALAASIADWAIWAGVTGTAGFFPGVSAEPVTAQAIITLRCMDAPRDLFFRVQFRQLSALSARRLSQKIVQKASRGIWQFDPGQQRLREWRVIWHSLRLGVSAPAEV